MRIDKFSKQELRESQTTINELTTQIKEWQDGVDFEDDSGEFQDVESIGSGGLPNVPSQPAVPNSRGMLSRDQSLRPDTWNSLGTSGNVFDNPSASVNSVSTPHRGMLYPWNPEATFGDPMQPSTGRPAARSEEKKILFTHRDSQEDRQPGILSFPNRGGYSLNHTVDQQRLQISELHFAFRRQDSKPKFFLFWDARIASALNQIIQNSYSKTKVSLEEQKAQKEDRFLRVRQIACMICDYFQVTGAHDTVFGCADLFTITLSH